MFKISKISLVLIFLIIFVLLSGFFAVKWAQVKGELGRKTKEEVTIFTDKAEYRQGEKVKITARNGLHKTIWYIKEVCPPSCCNLQRLEGNNWKNIQIPMECIQFTGPMVIKPDPLKPNEEIHKEWNMDVIEDSGIRPASSGTYRFSFYYGLTKDSYTEKTIYSNEFVIRQ